MTVALLPPLLAALAICVGACAGALARWGLSLWLNGAGPIPLGTLVANWVGGYLVGVAAGVFQASPQIDPVWRLLLITGFLGALTTFSTFSVEVVSMLMQNRFVMAIFTAAVHLLGSLTLTWLGLATVRQFAPN